MWGNDPAGKIMRRLNAMIIKTQSAKRFSLSNINGLAVVMLVLTATFAVTGFTEAKHQQEIAKATVSAPVKMAATSWCPHPSPQVVQSKRTASNG